MVVYMTINDSRFKTAFLRNLSRDGIADTCIEVVVRSGSAGVVREVKLDNLDKCLMLFPKPINQGPTK